MQQLQRALSLIYPDQCALCHELVSTPDGLCAACWGETPFLNGLVCDLCGTALPGEESEQGILCDDCLATPRPWSKGRAVVSYAGAGRRLVLSLKHADRTDLALPAAGWLSRAGHNILSDDTLLVPVPIHWTRLLRRRYNQAQELAIALGRARGIAVIPDALSRVRRTPMQDGLSHEERYENLKNAIRMNPRRAEQLKMRKICLIDDVMTTGATLSACAKALLSGGAGQVSVLVLARVEKLP